MCPIFSTKSKKLRQEKGEFYWVVTEKKRVRFKHLLFLMTTNLFVLVNWTVDSRHSHQTRTVFSFFIDISASSCRCT